MENATGNLESLRATASKGLLPYLWLHVPLLIGIAAYLGHSWMLTTALATMLALAPTLSVWRFGSDLGSRLLVGVGVVGMVALVVYQMGGTSWQIDGHMYFFASLALLAAYCDWRVELVSATAIALHHLVLNFVLPSAVFPGGSDFGRVVFHAVIVIVETGALVWLTWQLTQLFAVSEAATREAEEAHAAETAAYAEQKLTEQRMENERRRSMIALAEEFRQELGERVRRTVGIAQSVRSSADTLFSATTDSVEESKSVLTTSRGTSVEVQTVASAADQLSASVAEINRHMNRAASVASRAMDETQRTTDKVGQLKDSAAKIGEVVELIRSIAQQTNLLALNATIEAARAGEVGKGFSVVAGEVKALASQTARATEDIQSQILAIQTETEEAAGAITVITETITELSSLTATVAAAAQEQGAATQEIARSTEQAAAGVQHVTVILDRLAGSATDTSAAAAGGRDAAQMLSAECDGVADSVDAFVQRFCAA